MRFRNLFCQAALRRSVVSGVRESIRHRVNSRLSPRRTPLVASCLFLLLFLSSLFYVGNSQAASFSSTVYHSYTATSLWAYDLQRNNPDLVRVVQYGESSAGHLPLFAVEITSNIQVNDPSKSDFLFTAGIHAREVIGSEAALRIADDLVAGYNSTNPAIRSTYQNMLAGRDVWIIPQQNPDGRTMVEGGLSGQRKNWNFYPGQSQTGTTRGVDLNRNYPHLWNLASSNFLDDTYRGPSVLSESESKSLWDFVSDKTYFNNLLASVDFHSGAQTILTPWGSPTDFKNNQGQIPQEVQDKFASLAAELKLRTGLSTDRLTYDYYGTLSDSLYEKFGSYSMTEEIFQGGGDIYSLFNPTTATGRDAATKKALDSALYLLSDAAFTVVPEPSTFLLLAIAAIALLASVRRRL